MFLDPGWINSSDVAIFFAIISTEYPSYKRTDGTHVTSNISLSFNYLEYNYPKIELYAVSKSYKWLRYHHENSLAKISSKLNSLSSSASLDCQTHKRFAPNNWLPSTENKNTRLTMGLSHNPSADKCFQKLLSGHSQNMLFSYLTAHSKISGDAKIKILG